MHVKPDTKIVQGDFCREASLKARQIVGPFARQTEGVQELVIDSLNDLPQMGQPPTQSFGPTLLTTLMRRGDQLHLIALLKGSSGPLSCEAFILNELKRYEEALAAEEQAIKLNPGLLVFLIRGKDSGRAAWHYILVAQDKLSLFKQKLGTGNIDVSEYGKILYSGWGENPPPEIVETVKNQYS